MINRLSLKYKTNCDIKNLFTCFYKISNRWKVCVLYSDQFFTRVVSLVSHFLLFFIEQFSFLKSHLEKKVHIVRVGKLILADSLVPGIMQRTAENHVCIIFQVNLWYTYFRKISMLWHFKPLRDKKNLKWIWNKCKKYSFTLARGKKSEISLTESEFCWQLENTRKVFY